MNESIKEMIYKEEDLFEKKRAELLQKYKGKSILFKNGEVQGVYETDSEAYSAGIDKYGIDDVFLVLEMIDRPPSPISFSWEFGLINANS